MSDRLYDMGQISRAAEIERLRARLAEAVECCMIKDSRNLRLEARLAAAEALLSIAGQELLIGMIDPTATCYPQIRAFLARENERE